MKIDIPCRVGDTVWAIFKGGGNKRPLQGKVRQIYFSGKDMVPAIRVNKICTGHWGKDVFLTEQEAWDRIEELVEKCEEK